MKSIKTSLFVAAALAVALAFVSCNNEAQDVNVTFNPTSFDHEYYGFASGLVTTDDATVTILSEKPFAYVSYYTGYEMWEAEEKTNKMGYEVHVPISIKYTDSTIAQESSFSIYFTKIGNTYYYGKEEIEVSGSPEGSEFTIKSIKIGSYVITDFKFKRK